MNRPSHYTSRPHTGNNAPKSGSVPTSPPDPTFRQLTQEVLNIWSQPGNPDKALKDALRKPLNELTSEIFGQGSEHQQPISATISIYDEKRRRFRVELSVGPAAQEIQQNPPRTHGITAHVYSSRQPMIAPRLNHWPSGIPKPKQAMIDSKSIQSMAMFPLLFGQGEHEEAIGVLCIMSPDPILFNAQRIAQSEVFADKVAFIIQMARVNRRRLREESAIAMISQFAAEGNPETLAKVIARQAVTVTQSAYAVVFSINGERTQLNSAGLAAGNGLTKTSSRIELNLSDVSINGHVYRSKQPYYAPNLQTDELFYDYRSWDEGTASAYCVPLRADNDTLVGTLYVASNIREGLTKHDRNFIDMLASHAASALRSTSLLNNVIRFQLAISDVLPLSTQFTQIRQELARIGLDASGLFIATYNEGTRTIHFPKVRHYDRLVADDDPLRKPGQIYGMRKLGERDGLVDFVIQTQSSLLVKDFSQWSSSQQFAMDEYSDLWCCLVVPMFSHGQIVGTLGLRGYDKPEKFHEYDQQFLEVIANHVAIAIENAHRYTSEVRQRDFQSKVSEFHEKIANALPVQQQMTQIRVELQRLGIDTSGLFIATYDQHTQLIELPKVYDRGVLITPDEKKAGELYGPRTLGERMGLIDWCIVNSPRAFQVSDCSTWPHTEEVDFEYINGINCFVVSPMYRGHDLIGIVGLRGYDKPGMFDESHKELLGEIANFMAIVVENAQKVDTSQKKVELVNQQLTRQVAIWRSLSKFQREISNIDTWDEEIKDIWRCTQEALINIGVDPSYLYLAKYEAGQITFPYVFEEGKPISVETMSRPGDPYVNRMIGDRPDLTEWIIRHGRGLHFHSRQAMEQFKALNDDVTFIPQYSRSWIGVPIRNGDKIFGMIGLRSFSEDNAFDGLLKDFMENIAGQAGIVLDNARHLEESQEQTRYNKALVQAGRSIASAGLQFDAVLQTILQQAVEVTKAKFGTLQLVKDDYLEIASIWPVEMDSAVRLHMECIPISGSGITAKAVRKNAPQLIHNVERDPDYLSILPEIHSELAVVLRGGGKREGEVIGVINVEHENPTGLTQRHRSLLIDLSYSAAVAIDYADQYQALERARDIGLASTAIAWLGLFGADWQHTINQKTFSISNYVTGLREYIDSVETNGSLAAPNTDMGQLNGLLPFLHEGLTKIKSVADEIREVEFTQEVQLPPSISEQLIVGSGATRATTAQSGSSRIDDELEDMVLRWCRHHEPVELELQFNCPNVQVGIASQWLTVAIEKLVSNALKVMPSGGTLTVRTTETREGVGIAICDTGPGIPDEIRDYFLKRVIPRSASSEGSGMGVMIARFVALSHGGDLTWKPRRDVNGTELLMTLPITR